MANRRLDQSAATTAPLNNVMSHANALIPVDSSAIRAIGYDGRTLTVEFHSGRTYDHPDVPYHVFNEFLNAWSKGTYYNQNIRGRYK